VEYRDWGLRLKRTVNYHQLKVENSSTLTQLLTMKFCPLSKEAIIAMPDEKEGVYVPFFPLNW
jgi:hypothetical protein